MENYLSSILEELIFNHLPMSLTYKTLQEEIKVLSEEHLIYLDFEELWVPSPKNEIEDFKIEVQSIIESILIAKIIKKPKPGVQYDIPENTPVDHESLFSMYASLNHSVEQNKLIKLLKNICMESEYDIIDSFIEQYDMYGNDEIVEIIEATELINKIHPSITTYTLVKHLLAGEDFYDAIKLTLRDKWIVMEEKETQERAEPCHEVTEFLHAFNQLIFSKLGINGHLIPSGKKSVH